MTSSPKCDSDTNGSVPASLAPAERHIYARAKRQPDEPFCFLDFKDKYAHGTIRNALSSLRRKDLIRLHCRSGPAFYVISSGEPKMAPEKVTLYHRVGRGGVGEIKIDFGAFLDSLDWEDVCRVHDVCLVFSVNGLYELFCRRVSYFVEGSGDIQFGSFSWSAGRVLKVVVHRGGKVTCYLKCSDCPIEVSLNGLVSLTSFLGGIRVRIVDAAVSVHSEFEEKLVPDVSNWIVSQWHYGRDGAREISGPAFNVSFSTWFGELARIYTRHHGQMLKPRLEIHEKPRKTLPVAFAEKIDPALPVFKEIQR